MFRQYVIHHKDMKFNITPDGCVERITTLEVKRALMESKNQKAAGPGGILTELIKNGPDILIEYTTVLFNRCLQGEDVLEDWNLSYIIFNKRGKSKCQNYKGIRVIGEMGKH
ncbi:hypothetical protein Trydic_g21454 [Trypoxylus dichotomus]